MKKGIVLLLTLAAMAFLTSGCPKSEDNGKGSDTCPINGSVFVTTSDWTVGATAVIYGDPPIVACQPKTIVSSDAVPEMTGSNVYVVNRFGFDNIQALDGQNGFQTSLQFSVGNGSNPQDIAVVSSTKAYVSRLQNASLWVGNPSDGTMTTEIDLSAYADADGFPEASRMLLVGNRLFVALQRLNETDALCPYCPTDKSSIAVINTDTNAIVTVIDLVTKNPTTRLIYDSVDNKIYVGCAGYYQSWGHQTPDGGVETITITAPDTYNADGLVIDEATLGGDINALVVVSSTQAYAIVSDATFANYLVKFNPTTGLQESVLYTTFDYLPDLVMDGNGYLYLAERSQQRPGVMIWDTVNDTQVGDPIDVGLPPYSMAVIP